MKYIFSVITLLFFSSLNAQNVNLAWAKSMGGASDDAGNSIAIDASGNVYTTGSFSGTADFDPGAGTYNLSAAGNSDIFVSKLDASGNFVWAKSMRGNATYNTGNSIAVDASGNVYFTGHFSGTVDFDPGPGTYNLTASGVDAFVSKLDASGNFVWAKNIDGASTYGNSIAIDASSNVFIAGHFSGTVDFDPGPGTYNLTASGSSDDVFVSKLDALGNFVWAKNMGGASSFTGCNSIAVDASGNVYTTGLFNGTADFDPGPGTYNLTPVGFTDIFVSKLDASGNFVWAKNMGGASSYNSGNSIAVDASGNVYTTGYFQSTTDFDPGPGTYNVTAAGIYDIFVAKLNASGNFVWAKDMGGTNGVDFGNSIVVDGSSNVYTTGYFSVTADFDPGAGTYNLTATGTKDIFVSKLDASGNFVWAKDMGGTSNAYGNSIALNASGNAYTTGYFSGTVDFDPGAGTYNLTSSGTNDIFVSKLDVSGNFVWAKNMGGVLTNNGGKSVAVDASGNVYTTGFFSGSVDFDPGPGTYYLTSAGSSDIFITKLDASGNFVWAKNMGGAFNDGGASIAVDASGNVYSIGFFTGTADFDPGPGTYNLTSAGSADIYISKLDASGNFVWAKNMGGASYDQGQSITVDASGNVYTTGYFQGTADFDPGAGTYNLTSNGSYDIFVSKLDASGNFLWAKNMGGVGDDEGFSLTIDASGNVYTTGYFQGTADFDPGIGTHNLTAAGGYDIFVSKLDPSGNFLWAKSMGGGSYADGSSIAVDASGNVYTTGPFNGTVDFDPGPGTYNLTSNGSYDIFVSKLDASGNFLWAKGMGGSSDDEGTSIAIDASGNVYTTGFFDGSVDFDPGPGTHYLTTFSIGSDIFVSKLNASGNFVWAKNMGMGNYGPVVYDGGNSIAVNASGNVYIAGYFQGTADFDPGPGTYNLTSAGIYDIFAVKLSQTSVLPITLISFTAQKQQNDVITNWETASQLNFSHFEVERSLDATHFEKAGTVQPMNGSGDLNYQFKDLNAVNIYKNNGRLFYRLKMVDRDGQFKYSQVIVIDFSGKSFVSVYPNPANSSIHIYSDQTLLNIQVLDMAGKTIKQFLPASDNTYNVNDLETGMYFIKLIGKSETQTIKFSKL